MSEVELRRTGRGKDQDMAELVPHEADVGGEPQRVFPGIGKIGEPEQHPDVPGWRQLVSAEWRYIRIDATAIARSRARQHLGPVFDGQRQGDLSEMVFENKSELFDQLHH